MTTSTSSFAVLQTTDAEFRAWCAGVIALLTNIGLTQTTDTGQINTGTVVKPAAANTVQGYAVFRFNDSLQATKPIFFKFEFGSGAAATTPAMWLTVGQGSDGAGNLTNVLKARLQRSIAAGTVAVDQHACYKSTLGMAWFKVNRAYTASTDAIFFLAARSCSSDGTPNDTGIVTCFTAGSVDMESYDFATATAIDVHVYFHGYAALAASTQRLVTSEGHPLAMPCWFPVDNQVMWLPGILGVIFLSFAPLKTVYATPQSTEYAYLALTMNGAPSNWDPTGDGEAMSLLIWE